MARQLLDANPEPTEDEIRHYLSGNLCRCAAYPEIIEAVQSTGASKLQLVRFVIIPETANAILAQVLFMLEYNIRASSILGFVGAGGLGLIVQIYLQNLDYRRLATVLLLVLVIVLIMDGISAWLRRRFLLSTQAS